jgi:U3 small nucleolar ribonucleoprotein protein LCP5
MISTLLGFERTMEVPDTPHTDSIGSPDIDLSAVISTLDEMSSSFASTHSLVHELNQKFASSDASELDTSEGISLLSLKHHVLLSYMQSLVILSARRVLGETLVARNPPKQTFSDLGRDPRGSGTGDIVDSMIEGRVVLEKIKALEGRMRYQIEKLVRVAQEDQGKGKQDVEASIMNG